MKKLKIFGLPSHQSDTRTSGVDFARIIQPLTHLNGFDNIETTVFDINKETDWLYVAKNFDIIYLNYLNNPWGFAAMGAMARKHNVKIVMDLDDSLWDIKKDNPAHPVYKHGSVEIKNFTAICNEVDYITATNRYLKNVITHNTRKYADKVTVFPNYIDLTLYNSRPPFKDTNQIQLMHYGSSTHYDDLSGTAFTQGIDKLFAEYPNVTLRMVGAFIPKYRMRWGMRYENVYGDTDIYKWIKNKFPTYLAEADILVVPLTDDVYNRCKSPIKFLEASTAGKPGVWQKIRQYEEVIDGTNGLLAGTAEEWYSGLKRLVDDRQLRRTMGENAYKTVKKDGQIQDHVKEYADFFHKITT